jgi:hypothetical protein
MSRTARSSKRSTARVQPAPEGAALHADRGADVAQPDALNAGWGQDALSLCLMQTRGWFDMWQTLQEAQLRYLQDSAAAWDHALGELDRAHNLADVSAVSSEVLQSHLKNAWDNGSGALRRIVEIQAACMRRTGLSLPLALRPHAPADAIDATVAVVDSEAQANEAQLAQATEQWQRWFAQWQQGWQQGAGEWGRAVQRTLQAAQGTG